MRRWRHPAARSSTPTSRRCPAPWRPGSRHPAPSSSPTTAPTRCASPRSGTAPRRRRVPPRRPVDPGRHPRRAHRRARHAPGHAGGGRRVARRGRDARARDRGRLPGALGRRAARLRAALDRALRHRGRAGPRLGDWRCRLHHRSQKGNRMTATTVDIVDELAGITPGTPLDELRSSRPVTRAQLQASHDALFEPVDDAEFALAERLLVAAFATRSDGAGRDARTTTPVARPTSTPIARRSCWPRRPSCRRRPVRQLPRGGTRRREHGRSALRADAAGDRRRSASASPPRSSTRTCSSSVRARPTARRWTAYSTRGGASTAS